MHQAFLLLLTTKFRIIVCNMYVVNRMANGKEYDNLLRRYYNNFKRMTEVADVAVNLIAI